MLLYFKPFRDLDKFVGQNIGMLYNFISPGSIRRSLLNKPDDIDILRNSYLERTEKDLHNIIKKTYSEMGEPTPLIRDADTFAVTGDGVLLINVKTAKKFPDSYVKAIATHEMGHLDTNLLGNVVHQLANTLLNLANIAMCFHHSPTIRNIQLATLLSLALAGSYRRSEEFRCDEMTLKNGTAKDFPDALNATISYKEENSSFKKLAAEVLSAVFELVHSHPCYWSRKENLRQQQKRQVDNSTLVLG